jgi:putative transposase
VRKDDFQVYGARKVWLALNREGIPVARCTIERLMRRLGLVGARTRPQDPHHSPGCCGRTPGGSAGRRFNPPAPDRTWVADFTYVPTWSRMVYVAFVIDAYSWRILGWRAATSMRTSLVLDALDHAVWVRQREGVTDLAGLIHHQDAGSQYTSIAFTERLAEAGIDPSVGSVETPTTPWPRP